MHKYKSSLPLFFMCNGFLIGTHPYASNSLKFVTMIIADALHVCAMLTSWMRVADIRVMVMPIYIDLPFNVALLLGWAAVNATGLKSVRAWRGARRV